MVPSTISAYYYIIDKGSNEDAFEALEWASGLYWQSESSESDCFDTLRCMSSLMTGVCCNIINDEKAHALGKCM